MPIFILKTHDSRQHTLDKYLEGRESRVSKMISGRRNVKSTATLCFYNMYNRKCSEILLNTYSLFLLQLSLKLCETAVFFFCFQGLGHVIGKSSLKVLTANFFLSILCRRTLNITKKRRCFEQCVIKVSFEGTNHY